MSLDAAKAVTAPRHRTGAAALCKSGLDSIMARSALKVPCEKLAPLTSCALLRLRSQVRLHDTGAAVMEDERGNALFALAGLARRRR